MSQPLRNSMVRPGNMAVAPSRFNLARFTRMPSVEALYKELMP